MKTRTFGFKEYKDGSGEKIITVKVNKKINKLFMSVNSYSRNIKRMKNLYDFYLEHFEQRCSCSYDCCGHYFSSLREIKRKGKVITLKISYAQNY